MDDKHRTLDKCKFLHLSKLFSEAVYNYKSENNYKKAFRLIVSID